MKPPKRIFADYVGPTLAGAIPTVFVFTALFFWMSCDAVTLRQCVQHRPLAECRADVEALP